MKIFSIIMVLFLLNGCETYDTFKAGAKPKAAAAADEVDRLNLYGICIGNSRGSLKRNWLDTQEHTDLWFALCMPPNNIIVPALGEESDDN